MPGRSLLHIMLLILFSFNIAISQNKTNSEGLDSLMGLVEQQKYEAYLEEFKTLLRSGRADQLPAEMFKKAAFSYFRLSEFDSSAKYYRLSIKLAPIADSSFIGCRYSDLTLAYINADRLDSARESVSTALRYVDQVKPENKHDIYSSYATYLYNAKQYDSSLFYLNKGLDLLPESSEEYIKELTEYYRIFANVYRKMGEYNKSMNFEERCLDIARNSNALNCRSKCGIYYNLAVTNFLSGNYRRAIMLFDQAIGFMNRCQYYKNFRSALSNIAYSYMYLEESDSARKYFELSLENLDECLPGKKVTLLTNYGNFLMLEVKDLKKCYAVYQKARKIILQHFGRYHPKLRNLYSNIGDLYWHLDSMDSALICYQKALKIIDTSLSLQNYVANPDFYMASDIKTLKLMYRKICALNILLRDMPGGEKRAVFNDAVLTGVDYYLEAFYDLLSEKLFLTDKINSMKWELEYLIYVGIERAYELYQESGDEAYLQRAIAYSEASKSMILKINFYDVIEKRALPEEYSKLRNKLKRKINALSFQLDEEVQSDSLNAELLKLVRRYDSLEYHLGNEYPVVFDPVIKMTELEEWKEAAETNSLLLNYYHSWNVIHIFGITKEQIRWTRLKVDSSLDSSLKAMVDFIRFENRFDAGQKESYISHAYKLFRDLIPGEIPEKTSKIVFLPDDYLHYFPFELLLTQLPDSSAGYKSLPYLLKDYDISYSNSLSLMKAPMNVPKGRQKLLFVLPGSSSSDSNNSELLSPMEQARQEADVLLGIFGGELFVPDKFTDRLPEKLFGDYGILHFATHTRIDDGDPLQSSLMLWQNKGQKQNLNLSAADICNLELHAAMTVLSGCETGRGGMLSGEGVISLAWAFRYAGCPSVIMSMNRLEDETAKNLMIAYYKNLAKGMEKDHALRMAKLEYLKNCAPSRAHPGYWAGVISIGKQDAVRLSMRNTNFLYFLIAFVAILGFVLILFNRKRII